MIRTSFRRAQRLAPQKAPGLRARSVILARGSVMPWHSTRSREELVIVLAGHVQLETQSRSTDNTRGAGRIRTMTVQAGQCVFLPTDTIHQVVNRSRSQARYLYVTAPAT